MFPKINNNISDRNKYINKTNQKSKDNHKPLMINNSNFGYKKNSKNNKTTNRLFNNVKIDNINNINTNNKEKSNNVTNNICIIIKTINNKEIGKEKINYIFRSNDSFRESQNQSTSIKSENVNILNPNKTKNFKNKKFESYIDSLKTYNDSLINKKLIKNSQNKTHKKEINLNNNKPKKYTDLSIKTDYNFQKKANKCRNKYISFLSPINSINHTNISIEKKNKNFRQILFTDISDKSVKNNDRLITSPINIQKINKYKESILVKKQLLGINLNIKEKKKLSNIKYDKFIDYDKEKEKIEKQILLNDEIIRKGKNNDKIQKPKRIFSWDKYDINNKNMDKSKKTSIDSFNFDNNISRIDISYMQTEYNRDIIKKDINSLYKKVRKNKSLNIKKNMNNTNKDLNNNIDFRNTLYLSKSINNFNLINKRNNKIMSKNNSFMNNKSCMDIFIKEEKMKRNISIILKDIRKLINKSKNNNKYKSPRKPFEKILSSREKEIRMMHNTENGKTLCCIKKRSKEKKINKVERININKNLIKEFSKEKIDYFIPEKENNINKQENKILDINIPRGQIMALKRIKLKIENFKKNKLNRNKDEKENTKI